jgi:hypothetical protein
MPCYFLRDGTVAGVDMLPLGVADEDAIARAHVLLSKRRGLFDERSTRVIAGREPPALAALRPAAAFALSSIGPRRAFAG